MQTFEAATLHSLPVIAVLEGRIMGRVGDTVIDPVSHRLIGVMLTAQRGSGDYLDVRQVLSLGPHAVTVKHGSDIQGVEASARAKELREGGIRLRGAPVATEDGQTIGKIDRILIDGGGRVTGYRSSVGGLRRHRRNITPSDVIAVGEDLVIVKNSVRDEGGRRTVPDENTGTSERAGRAAPGAE